MAVHEIGDCVMHKWYRKLSGLSIMILGPGFYSHPSFGQLQIFLANLLKLFNLLGRNLGKTPMVG